MSSVVIDVRRAEDARDVVHRAVQSLVEGKLVAFPTETVYGLAASALSESAVAQLSKVKGRTKNHPFTLAIKSADDALDYAPDMSPLGRRLARRCWPGPVTLVLDNSHPDSLLRRLPKSVQQAVSPQGTVGLRVPGHPLILDVLQMLAGPIALSSANRAGEADAVEAEEIVESLNGDVQLILNDGRSKFGQPSSVVQVNGQEISILRTGVVSSATIRRLSSFMVLFVCTGNTCRSPMAEVLCRSQIAKRLGCKSDEVEDRGVIVASAGIAAGLGGRPSTEAVQVMTSRGLDLSLHESQPLSDHLVRSADIILTMTHSHREAIVTHWPQAAERVRVLSRDRCDVSDPIGGPVKLYTQCADQIEGMLKERLEEFDLAEIKISE